MNPRSRLRATPGALLLTTVAASLVAQTAEPIRFARNAGVANDGRVAFTYQDDIWSSTRMAGTRIASP